MIARIKKSFQQKKNHKILKIPPNKELFHIENQLEYIKVFMICQDKSKKLKKLNMEKIVMGIK